MKLKTLLSLELEYKSDICAEKPAFLTVDFCSLKVLVLLIISNLVENEIINSSVNSFRATSFARAEIFLENFGLENNYQH
jgi:hypothetical protein